MSMTWKNFLIEKKKTLVSLRPYTDELWLNLKFHIIKINKRE